jgi:hypothetical protein
LVFFPVVGPGRYCGGVFTLAIRWSNISGRY